MQNKSHFWYLWVIILVAAGCAIQTSPTGGPPDKKPPEIIRVKPLNQTLNFEEKKIIIYADSYLKPLSYGKEVFVSPILSKPPKISVFDRRVEIQFQEKLNDSTTYVITLTDLTDHFSGQKISSQFTYAFSTGNILDSMSIIGSVTDGVTGLAEKDMSVLLFEVDSIKGYDFLGKRPDYLARTDANGQFTLSYLKKKNYRIFAVKDGDQSNTFNQKNEKPAIDTIPMVVFPDTGKIAPIHHLIAFTEDNSPPLLKGYEWTGKDGLLVELSETPLMDSLRIFMTDTLKKTKTQATSFVYLPRDKKIFIQAPRLRPEYSFLILENMSDSLGNKADTALLVIPKTPFVLKEKPLVQKPVFSFENNLYIWYFPETFVDTTLAMIFVTDSAGTKINEKSISLTINGLKGTLEFPQQEKLPAKLMLKMDGTLFGMKDTVFSFPVPKPDTAQYGILNGTIKTEGYEGKIVVVLNTGGGGGGKSKDATPTTGSTYILYDRSISLKNMLPGTYTVKVIFDKDGNGCWTPGLLKTGRLPEKIITVKETLNIRANWELDKQEILAPYPKAGTSAKGGTDKTNPKETKEGKEGKK